MPQVLKRTLLFQLILNFSFLMTGRAETSLLTDLMKASEAVVLVTSENASLSASPASRVAGKPRGLIPAKFTRTGTGIIVTAGGLVATNVHTIQQAARIKVTLVNGSTFIAKHLRSDPAHDLALLQIQGTGTLPFLRLADSSQAKLNSRVFSVGGSSLLKNTISEGKLHGIGQRKNPAGSAAQIAQIFQVSFDLYQGDSGSPVFNERAEVLGIISAAAQRRGKTSFAIPSYFIRELLKS